MARSRGQYGAIIAAVGGYRAGTWLETRGYSTRADVMRAVTHGMSRDWDACHDLYQCSEKSQFYRSPHTNPNYQHE